MHSPREIADTWSAYFDATAEPFVHDRQDHCVRLRKCEAVWELLSSFARSRSWCLQVEVDPFSCDWGVSAACRIRELLLQHKNVKVSVFILPIRCASPRLLLPSMLTGANFEFRGQGIGSDLPCLRFSPRVHRLHRQARARLPSNPYGVVHIRRRGSGFHDWCTEPAAVTQRMLQCSERQQLQTWLLAIYQEPSGLVVRGSDSSTVYQAAWGHELDGNLTQLRGAASCW